MLYVSLSSYAYLLRYLLALKPSLEFCFLSEMLLFNEKLLTYLKFVVLSATVDIKKLLICSDGIINKTIHYLWYLKVNEGSWNV